MTDSGMLPRFLLADTKAEAELEPATPYRADPAILESWNRLVTGVLQNFRSHGDEPATVSPTEEALEAIRIFTNECKSRTHPGGDLRDISPYPLRWGENAWRLALVLHTATHGTQAASQALDLDTAENAVALTRWFSSQQLDFLATGRNERIRQRLESLISLLMGKGGTETLRNLKKSHGYEPEEVADLAQVFPQQVTISELKNPEGGRPSKVASIHTDPNP